MCDLHDLHIFRRVGSVWCRSCAQLFLSVKKDLDDLQAVFRDFGTISKFKDFSKNKKRPIIFEETSRVQSQKWSAPTNKRKCPKTLFSRFFRQKCRMKKITSSREDPTSTLIKYHRSKCQIWIVDHRLQNHLVIFGRVCSSFHEYHVYMMHIFTFEPNPYKGRGGFILRDPLGKQAVVTGVVRLSPRYLPLLIKQIYRVQPSSLPTARRFSTNKCLF